LQQRVVEKFSWQNTARQLLNAYDLAIAKKRGQGRKGVA